MGEAAEDQSEASGLSRSTHFIFENKVFQIEGCYFSIVTNTNEVMFHIPMGDMMGALKLNALCSEFNIEDGSSDSELLNLVRAGLPFVRRIRPNDCIPSEVLDGTASWHIDPDHEMLAKNKLSICLIGWLQGNGDAKMDKATLMSLESDSGVKERINEAFGKISEKLKIDRTQIIARFDDLAKELAYIEALRDYYSGVFSIFRNFKNYQEHYSADQLLLQDIERQKFLMRPPVAAIREQFEQIDGNCTDVYAMLQAYEKKVDFIRDNRDRLHLQTSKWDDLKEIWKNVPDERCEEAKLALIATYKFLAKHFSVSHSW